MADDQQENGVQREEKETERENLERQGDDGHPQAQGEVERAQQTDGGDENERTKEGIEQSQNERGHQQAAPVFVVNGLDHVRSGEDRHGGDGPALKKFS